MNPDLQYTRVTLDRADARRRSVAEIDALWNDPACRIVPMHESRNFFDAALAPIVISRAAWASVAADAIQQSAAQRSGAQSSGKGVMPWAFLGLNKGIGYFSVQCSESQVSQLHTAYPGAGFHDLRTAAATLNPELASILAYSRGLSHWHSVSGYCSRCGGKNKLEAAGHAMRCQQCHTQGFPRTDPAVIMLVEREDAEGKQCLLGRSPAWPSGCYSTLAGFVETGESLEAAVIREVFEESGVIVKAPRYVASQPWPFPQSIMLGFVATAVSDEIILDEQELANAAWFTAEELTQFGEWADGGEGFKLPRTDSIARYLIDCWIADQRL